MKKVITFRRANRADALFVADRLRKADTLEVGALGFSGREALLLSLAESDVAWTGCIDGVPAMLLGCRQSILSPAAMVWALGTDLCTSAPREMLVYGRKIIKGMLKRYPSMYNYCDARYKKAHRWLKKLGFTVHPAEPFGAKGAMFCKITIGGIECA